MEDDRDIVSITLTNSNDRGPLHYLSGEELSRQLEIIEAAEALVAAENRLRAALAKGRRFK